MDEEDLAELRDSQTLVLQNEEVDIAGRYAGDLASKSTDVDNEQECAQSILSHSPSHIYRSSMSLALEKALFPTPKDSPAAKILTKMGWRHGQGIGPRLTWQQKRLQDAQAKSARILTLDDLKLGPNDEDEEAQKYTYPRMDTPLTVVLRKDNAHGLGYTPGLSLNDSLGNGHDPQSTGPRISGRLIGCSRFVDLLTLLPGGFGLGALNDADEDDIDVYDLGPSSRRGLTAYEAGDENRYRHSINRKSVPRSQTNAPRVSPFGPIYIHNHYRPRIQSRNAPLETFGNGEPVLAEFVLADAPVTDDRWHVLALATYLRLTCQ